MDDIGTAYDGVATLYAELFSDMLATRPIERGLLAAFAELVRDAGPVADVGCGPGHLTAYLNSLGAVTFGVDVSAQMIALARAAHPDLRFEPGSMTALDLPDGVLGGILAHYSVIHTPPDELPAVLHEFHRVLAPGGQLLLGFFAGDEPVPQEFDHKVTRAYRWSPDALAEMLREAGLSVAAKLVREPYEDERFQQAQLLAKKV